MSATTRQMLGFESFFQGGFECSTHVLRSGRRLELLASTRHQEFARLDYERLRGVGIATARDGIRWHLVETEPGRFQFESVRGMIRAALESGVEVIWDLVHFGWPHHVDPMAPDFPDRLADLAVAFARVLRQEGVDRPAIVPINEISFLSFAGGDAGFFNPYLLGRGPLLKEQLVRGALAAGRAARAECPKMRVLYTDPLIHVAARRSRHDDRGPAAAAHASQYEAMDMISGRRQPQLGGSPDAVDGVGLNYYVHNQWFFPGGHGSVVPPSSVDHRPLSELLVEAYGRHRKPLFIAETGIEDAARPIWLRYVMSEVRTALAAGAAVEGVCLYPIVNHPGWDDDRHCHNGLWDYADDAGERAAYIPLLEELDRQRGLMDRFFAEPDAFVEECVPGDQLDAAAGLISEITEQVREG